AHLRSPRGVESSSGFGDLLHVVPGLAEKNGRDFPECNPIAFVRVGTLEGKRCERDGAVVLRHPVSAERDDRLKTKRRENLRVPVEPPALFGRPTSVAERGGAASKLERFDHVPDEVAAVGRLRRGWVERMDRAPELRKERKYLEISKMVGPIGDV